MCFPELAGALDIEIKHTRASFQQESNVSPKGLQQHFWVDNGILMNILHAESFQETYS